MSSHKDSSKVGSWQPRQSKNGINLAPHQAVSHPAGLNHELVQIPSTSIPNWGGMFVVDLKDKGMEIHNISLQFNISRISGLSFTSVNNTVSPPITNQGTYVNAAFLPAWYLFSRIELVQNNVILDTIYSGEQFLVNNILYSDKERLAKNTAAGHYIQLQHRITKAQKTSDYIVNLHTLFDESKIAIITQNHEVQLRIYMSSLSDVVCNVTSGLTVDDGTVYTITGTPYATINFCNAIVKATKLHKSGIANVLNDQMKKQAHDHLFHDVRWGQYSLPYSVGAPTTQQIVLTSIVGKVSALFFTVRNQSQLYNDRAFQYLPIERYELLDATGTSLVGGQAINAENNRKLLETWSASTYQEEIEGGVASGLIYNQNSGANVYVWSFSDDIVDSMRHGKAIGSHHFLGNEIIKLYLPDYSALSNFGYVNMHGNGIDMGTPTVSSMNGLQIDVWAFCQNFLHQEHGTVRKITL